LGLATACPCQIPICEAFRKLGMHDGPMLTLLVSSSPSMLVLRSIMGWKKTLVFTLLVIVMATITGMNFGLWF
jgi:uncharacterized protein